jgi:uncharacterized protein (DUF427 family)
MKTPGPDHPITMARNPNKIRVTLGGQVIAETTRALTLKESTYPAVHYIPPRGRAYGIARTQQAFEPLSL